MRAALIAIVNSRLRTSTNCGRSRRYRRFVPRRFGGLGFGTDPKGTFGLFNLLRLIGRGNLATGRLFEGHVNAIALVALYGTGQQIEKVSQDASEGHLFAVWNTDSAEGLRFAGTNLRGAKAFCSAAGYATRALVTARTGLGGSQLLSLSLVPGERTEPMEFKPQGMRAATSKRVVFDGFSVSPNAFIGKADDYIKEPAFSAGAWRASAVTLGGLEALIEEARTQLVERGRHRNPHQQARMGRAIIAQETARLWCRRAALIAENSETAVEAKTAYVNFARIAIEGATMDAMRLVQRSLGLTAFFEANPVERIMRDLGNLPAAAGPR
jgi:alkylation response protein AidB-like acyl-CoA dehydrogenase